MAWCPRSLIFLLPLAVALPLACNPKLTEVVVPDAGVALKYAWTPGAHFRIDPRISNRIASPAGDIYNALEFRVELESRDEEDGQTLMVATVHDIRVDSRVPAGAEIAALNRKAAEGLDGMELRFRVDTQGHVRDMPPPPENVPMETRAVIALVTSAIRLSFPELPAGPISTGESWELDAVEKEGISTQGMGTFEGLAKDEKTGAVLARFKYESTTEIPASKSAAGAMQMKAVSSALFGEDGVPREIERALQGEAAGMVTNLDVQAKWRSAP